MRVVGAPRHFHYGAAAGACGCFQARLHHASVAPRSDAEHYKIAYFFRRSTMGERRAKRALGGGGGGGAAAVEEAELARRRKTVATELVSAQAASGHDLLL